MYRLLISVKNVHRLENLWRTMKNPNFLAQNPCLIPISPCLHGFHVYRACIGPSVMFWVASVSLKWNAAFRWRQIQIWSVFESCSRAFHMFGLAFFYFYASMFTHLVHADFYFFFSLENSYLLKYLSKSHEIFGAMFLKISTILWWFFQKLFTCGVLWCLGFVLAWHFLHLAYYFGCEKMVLNPMRLKFCMCKLDTFRDFLV